MEFRLLNNDKFIFTLSEKIKLEEKSMKKTPHPATPTSPSPK